MVMRLVVLVVLALPSAAWAQAEREAPSAEAIDRAARRVLDDRYQGEPGERTGDRMSEEQWQKLRDALEREARERGEDMERWEQEQRERAEREQREREVRERGEEEERYHRRRGGRGGEGRRRYRRGDEESEDVDLGDAPASGGGGAVSSIVAYLLYGLMIVGGLFLVLFIIREIMRRKGDADVEDEAPEVKEEEAPDEEPKAELQVPLDEAELLAQQGKYAEAIHLLLLRTFQELARVADVTIAASLTSREILARIPLRPGARDALAELVDVVENTWFGDDVPGELQWQRCKSQFDRFVAIYRAPAPSLKEAA